MPRQPQVHFRLKPVDKYGTHTIYLEFLYNTRRLFYSFGQTIRKKDWNEAKQRVKNKLTTTLDGKFSLNELLDNLEDICQKTYNESIKKGIPAPEVLREAMEIFINQNHNVVVTEKTTLFKLIESFIEGEIKISTGKRRGRDKGQSCLKNYYTTKVRLKDFEAAEKYLLDFDKITMDFFNKYVTYLTNIKKLKPNTIAKDIATIKVFMNEAVDRELTSNMHFKKKSFSYSEEETDHVYLNEQELNDLYKFDLSSNKRLEQVRDLFIFGCWVGLRYSDYSSIKPGDIKQIDGEYFIDIITQKTKERAVIPCNPVVLEIFAKYGNNTNRLPRAIRPQKFNEYIKEVCKAAGEAQAKPLKSMIAKGRLISKPDLLLWQCVSSHTARRSFATNYYLQGFPTIDLMKITTHRTESSFMKYLRISKLDTAKRLAAHNKKNWSAMMLRVA